MAKGQTAAPAAAEPSSEAKAVSAPQRKIPGNLPYLPASGTLKKALERLIEPAQPDKFNADFLENVLKLKGGSARGTIPILKRMGFLGNDGSPTDLYARFRTDSGRAQAALQGLRKGFPEIFKRSEYAHTVEDSKLRDIILEITGLKASDPVAQAIKSTFNVVKSYVPAGTMPGTPDEEPPGEEGGGGAGGAGGAGGGAGGETGELRLAYNINIVLPETSDLKVLNAIFRSIKENLMR
jgi:hypothetical protein